MNRFYYIIALGLLAVGLVGCGVAERSVPRSGSSASSSSSSSSSNSNSSDDSGSNTSLPSAISVSKFEEVQVSLEQAHRDWKGTPYVLGGSSSRGIDCSAFMQIVFDRYFGVDLPRNTKKQLYAGSSIRRQSLHTGDLVFFKTGRKTLHVGVVVEEDEFLHASTSQGVTISSLDDYYWRSRYLSGRRVFEF